MTVFLHIFDIYPYFPNVAKFCPVLLVKQIGVRHVAVTVVQGKDNVVISHTAFTFTHAHNRGVLFRPY